MAKVTLDNLGKAIEGILADYGDDVKSNLDEIIQAAGQMGVKALKSESQEKFGTTNKHKKKYANTWKVTAKKTRVGTNVVIHNTQPGLPHLLENGHVSRNGTGRTFGTVPGREHIKPVEDELENWLDKEMRKL